MRRTASAFCTIAVCAAVLAALAGTGRSASAQQPFLGQIQYFPYTFAPRGWTFCNGQLLPISQHTALFSLLGTVFGGDGRTSFALPDMRGRFPIHPGRGPGLTARKGGERGGAEKVTLTAAELASHSHALNASGALGDVSDPTGATLAQDGFDQTYSNAAPDTNMHPDHIVPSGGGDAHDNMPPWLALNCNIALTGLFPSK